MEDPRVLLPFSALTGSVLLVLADLIATRAASPVVLPIGAVTSLVGVVLFFVIISIRGRKTWKP